MSLGKDLTGTRILHINTTQRTMRVELVGTGYVFESSLDDRKHDAIVASESKRLLERAGISFGDLCAYAVTAGGGSWTGNRVGVAAIKAFHMVHPKPIIVVKEEGKCDPEEIIRMFMAKEFTPIEKLEPHYDSEFKVTVKK